MTDHLRTLAELATRFAVACYPERRACPTRTATTSRRRRCWPASSRRFVRRRLAQRGRRLLRHDAGPHRGARRAWSPGKPARVPAAARALRGVAASSPSTRARTCGPVIVGERTNVIGSREVQGADRRRRSARRPPRSGAPRSKRGAQIIDVCLANPDRDELADMRPLPRDVVISKVKVPLMIDSTDAKVIELALTLLPGQGHHQLDQPRGRRGALRAASCPLARSYGAALVVGCIDEDKQQGMAVTRAAQARGRRALPTSCSPRSTACPPRTSIFDPLVFPCATGDAQYVGCAVETIEGVRLIKAALPAVQDRARHLQRVASACPPRAARC